MLKGFNISYPYQEGPLFQEQNVTHMKIAIPFTLDIIQNFQEIFQSEHLE